MKNYPCCRSCAVGNVGMQYCEVVIKDSARCFYDVFNLLRFLVQY